MEHLDPNFDDPKYVAADWKHGERLENFSLLTLRNR